MGEVLSQDEIDKLLAGLSSGEIDAEEMQGKDNGRLRIMTSNGRRNSQKNTSEH